MRRLSVVLVVMLALMAGGCGGSASTTLTDAAAPSALGAERALAQAAAADIGAFRMVFTAELAGLDEFGGESVSFGMEAAFSETGDRGEMRLDLGEIMAAAAAEDPMMGPEMAALFGDEIEMRFIDSTVYMSSGFWAWLFPVDTPWVAFTDDGSAPMETGFDMETFAAEEFLAMLEVVDSDAEVVGTEVIDGVETVHVAGRVSIDDLARLDPDFLTDMNPAGTDELDIDTFDIDVWIGPDDVLRRLSFGATDGDASVRFTVDITDVDGQIDVMAPPADEITWLDDLMGDAFQFGT